MLDKHANSSATLCHKSKTWTRYLNCSWELFIHKEGGMKSCSAESSSLDSFLFPVSSYYFFSQTYWGIESVSVVCPYRSLYINSFFLVWFRQWFTLPTHQGPFSLKPNHVQSSDVLATKKGSFSTTSQHLWKKGFWFVFTGDLTKKWQ